MQKSQVFKAQGGRLETLEKGFLDLSRLGPVEVRRSSDIKFDDKQQQWYIHLLEVKLQSWNPQIRDFYFDTYQEAVDFEVEFLNNCRLDGLL